MTHFILSAPKLGLIAHRGASLLAPENTFAAFERVSENGLNWLEFDVQLSKDNQLVIFHDDELDRTTNGRGRVRENSLAQLQTLDAGSWFSREFSNQKIPTFEDTLRYLLNQQLVANVELKVPENVSSTYGPVLVEKIVQAVQHLWPKDLDLPLFSCFDWSLLHQVRALLPQAPIGFLAQRYQASDLHFVANQGNAAYHCDHQHLTPERIKRACDLDVPILTYTVNQPKEAQKLLALGVFGVFTDNPLLLTC